MAKEKLTKAEQIRRLREVTADEDKYFTGVLGNPVALAARWGVPLSESYHNSRKGNVSATPVAQNCEHVSRKPSHVSLSGANEIPSKRGPFKVRTNKKLTLKQLRRWRIRKGIRGASERPRMSVRFINDEIHIKFIDDVAGKTSAAASMVSKGEREKLSSNAAAAKTQRQISVKNALAKGRQGNKHSSLRFG